MGKYIIEIVAKAEKEFLKLPEHTKITIRNRILSLEDNPRPFGAKKLRETEYYRIRSGDYRAIYTISDNSRQVNPVRRLSHGALTPCERV